MQKLAILAGLFLALTACEASGIPNFERMSTTELAEYNNGRPLAQMIVSGEDARSFSRVRRRRCMTVEAMYGSAEQASQLGLLHTVPGYVQSDGF